jgi:hypothetical protein
MEESTESRREMTTCELERVRLALDLWKWFGDAFNLRPIVLDCEVEGGIVFPKSYRG